jgi:hypothetical protein
MNINIHKQSGGPVAEIISETQVLASEQDVIRLLEELYGSGANQIILHQENILPDFFDLRTGLAGAILQKFTNYHLQVAIVGDFTQVTSKSLKAFIYESNRGKQIFFLESVAAALEKFELNGP